ncbi:hypothetical protein [Acetomicrobium sp. S15 = DSM 107314]|uniref:hypothetical protein n=1 Tax=Acetomicrobium sp. S15 = DSM 107314 TaxID=2529858 RepID=UPI0018E14914|nr:hypothetical protein [Acetomicrobium sp. S15 = DSM 107314]
MRRPVLKIFMEKPEIYSCCLPIDYREMEEMETFHLLGEREKVGSLLRRIKREYGDKIEVELIDPRNVLYFFEIFKYKIRAKEIAWVLDNKAIFRGIPSWDELRAALDQAIAVVSSV